MPFKNIRNRLSQKQLSGYLSLEASLIMPMVLLLYVLIILGSFYLYNRCTISQNNYLLALRGSRFTQGSAGYGAVIYDRMEDGMAGEDYLYERLLDRARLYPFCQAQTQTVSCGGTCTVISVSGYGDAFTITKEAENLNIMKIVKGTRTLHENGILQGLQE